MLKEKNPKLYLPIVINKGPCYILLTKMLHNPASQFDINPSPLRD